MATVLGTHREAVRVLKALPVPHPGLLILITACGFPNATPSSGGVPNTSLPTATFYLKATGTGSKGPHDELISLRLNSGNFLGTVGKEVPGAAEATTQKACVGVNQAGSQQNPHMGRELQGAMAMLCLRPTHAQLMLT